MGCSLHVPLIALHDDGDWSAFLGTYRNSVAKRSSYAGLAWQPLHVERIRAGLYAGAATGYTAAKVVPVAGAALSYSLTQRSQIHTLVIPKTSLNPATLAVSYSLRFK
jgi:fibrillarin-like rRNA methylase